MIKIQKYKKLPLILVIAGVLFILIGLFAVRSSGINPKWEKVMAVVIGSETKSVTGGTVYASILEYKVENKPYKITSQSTQPFAPQLGAEFLVAYNPSTHGEAKLVSDVKVPGHLKTLPIIGAVSLLSAAGLFVYQRRRKEHDKRIPMPAPAHQVMQRPHDALDDIADSLAPIPAAAPAPVAAPQPQAVPVNNYQQQQYSPQPTPVMPQPQPQPSQGLAPAPTPQPRPAQPMQRPSLQEVQARRARFAAQQNLPNANRLVQ